MNVVFAGEIFFAVTRSREIRLPRSWTKFVCFASAERFWFHPGMPNISLAKLVAYCDQTLRTAEVGDYDGAVNGLQVANGGQVTRLIAAVDASLPTVKRAVAAGADLLVVHHGLFWTLRQPWTGGHYELIQTLVKNNLAVYSSHLPLDIHPRLGNNAQLCAALGFKQLTPFFPSHGQEIGFATTNRVSRGELKQRLEQATGAVSRLLPGGPEICRRIGVVTGGAGSEVKRAAAAGVDTFITGEGPHWTYALAEELGLNVFYGGHYATETFGVKALAADLSKKFKLPWTFLNHPTGL